MFARAYSGCVVSPSPLSFYGSALCYGQVAVVNLQHACSPRICEARNGLGVRRFMSQDATTGRWNVSRFYCLSLIAVLFVICRARILLFFVGPRTIHARPCGRRLFWLGGVCVAMIGWHYCRRAPNAAFILAMGIEVALPPCQERREPFLACARACFGTWAVASFWQLGCGALAWRMHRCHG